MAQTKALTPRANSQSLGDKKRNHAKLTATDFSQLLATSNSTSRKIPNFDAIYSKVFPLKSIRFNTKTLLNKFLHVFGVFGAWKQNNELIPQHNNPQQRHLSISTTGWKSHKAARFARLGQKTSA